MKKTLRDNKSCLVSNYIDIKESYKNVRKKRIKEISYLALKTIFSCEFIAHVSSTVSVITLYWGVWVNRKFDKDNIIDWLVCVIALGIIIWGLYNIVNKIRKKYTVVLNYNLLHDFLTVARCEAENTIINIGGDLSWLDKDLESLREIKNEHSNIKIRIYYDKKSLSLNTKLLVSKIRKEKIVELIPYPESITPPSIRCMITDYNGVENEMEDCKIYLYSKHKRIDDSQHLKDKFLWQEYNSKNNRELYDAISSLLEMLEKLENRCILVGVTGINNCGKTSIIEKCKKILAEDFTVRIVPDLFVNIHDRSEIIKVNYKILLQSLFVINESYKEQIIIFDRTPFDNFMYYIMREMEKKHFMYDRNKKNSILMEYGNIIEKEQNKFDLIFKVKRKYENTNESTTWVSINERKRVSALYKEQEYNFIPKYSEIYEIGSETFVDDVTVAAEKMAQKIYDYYYM